MARTTEPLTLTSFRRLDQWTSVCYLPKLLAESGQYFQHERIIRIDEVDKEGVSKISKLEGGNVTQFPAHMYNPGGNTK